VTTRNAPEEKARLSFRPCPNLGNAIAQTSNTSRYVFAVFL
jgi:hypothetical protein